MYSFKIGINIIWSIIIILLIYVNYMVSIFSTGDMKLKKTTVHSVELNYEPEVQIDHFVKLTDEVINLSTMYFSKASYNFSNAPEVFLSSDQSSYLSLTSRIPFFTDASSGVYFFNRIYINGNIDESGDHSFIHEYSHYLFHEVSFHYRFPPNELPIWFQEGFCEYVAKKVVNERGIPPQKIRPVNEINKGDDDFYSISYLYMFELAQMYGETVFEDIMIKYAKVRDFDEAFYNVTSIPLNQFHETLTYNSIGPDGNPYQN